MIKVLASGSKGNCYIIQAGEEFLLLECGISFKDIKKGLNFHLSKVIGCLVTHSHMDHSKAIKDLTTNGIDVYSSEGTLVRSMAMNYRAKTVKGGQLFNLGKFTILPFDVEHDAAEPLGFLIQHPAIGKILFATDTYYLKYKFQNVDHILIECNYSEDILEHLPPYRARLLKSHMSLETLKETLKTWDLEGTKDITLIHISDTNGDEERFRKEIEELTSITTYVAVPGLQI